MSVEYERHPASAALPEMDDETYASLVTNMEARGFDATKPIIIANGQIVAGYHRYRAANDAGVDPVFDDRGEIEDSDIEYIVKSDELDRRHLPPGERVGILLDIYLACGRAFGEHGGARFKCSNEHLKSETITFAGLAKDAGVSETTARRAIDAKKRVLGLVDPPPPPPPPHETPPATGSGDDKGQEGNGTETGGQDSGYASGSASDTQESQKEPDDPPQTPETPPDSREETEQETEMERLQNELDVALARAEDAEAKVEGLIEKIAILTDGGEEPSLEAVKRERAKAAEIQAKLDRASKLANNRMKKLTAVKNALLEDDTDNATVISVLKKHYGVARNV